MSQKCEHCIHFLVCNAKLQHDTFAKEWNKKFTHVQMIEDLDLAEYCTEFKTLSDVHISSSKTFQIMIERFNQIEELHKKETQSMTSKESSELEKAFGDVNKLFLTLDAQEKILVKKYASTVIGVKVIES